jgi:hypothetical protein
MHVELQRCTGDNPGKLHEGINPSCPLMSCKHLLALSQR